MLFDPVCSVPAVEEAVLVAVGRDLLHAIGPHNRVQVLEDSGANDGVGVGRLATA